MPVSAITLYSLQYQLLRPAQPYVIHLFSINVASRAVPGGATCSESQKNASFGNIQDDEVQTYLAFFTVLISSFRLYLTDCSWQGSHQGKTRKLNQ